MENLLHVSLNRPLGGIVESLLDAWRNERNYLAVVIIYWLSLRGRALSGRLSWARRHPPTESPSATIRRRIAALAVLGPELRG